MVRCYLKPMLLWNTQLRGEVVGNHLTNLEERWEGDRVGRRSIESSTCARCGTLS